MSGAASRERAVLERWTPSSPEDHTEVIRALEEILTSRQFCNSKRYPALLRYIVEQTLSGHGDEIKERTTGALQIGHGGRLQQLKSQSVSIL